MRGSTLFNGHNAPAKALTVDLTGVRVMGAPAKVHRIVQTPRADRFNTVQLEPMMA